MSKYLYYCINDLNTFDFFNINRNRVGLQTKIQSSETGGTAEDAV